ncbi:MAG: DUF4231 domain-containing protein [Erysipelotrichaceae bacterium]|nr:DUF4231 domain-containing protein [Erysipelotrichaceae bacterium]
MDMSKTQKNNEVKFIERYSPEDYMNARLDQQIKWYDQKSIGFKNLHFWLVFGSIILSSLGSFIAILGFLLLEFTLLIQIVSSVLGIIVALCLALDKFNTYQELHLQYRSTCEKLNQEKLLYLTRAGDYTSSDDNSNFRLLVQRCESVMATETGNWAQLKEKKT